MKIENERLSTILSGVAGEYYVAAELSARGYIASITLRNTKGVDILCSNADASKSVAIQVKTNHRSNRDWILNEKSENYIAENLFYVFVNLNLGQKSPDYFIVPSTDVAKFIKESHQSWLATPGRGGKDHNDNSMRKFSDINEKYINCWDLLGLRQ
jgi:hypothetical protein